MAPVTGLSYLRYWLLTNIEARIKSINLFF